MISRPCQMFINFFMWSSKTASKKMRDTSYGEKTSLLCLDIVPLVDKNNIYHGDHPRLLIMRPPSLSGEHTESHYYLNDGASPSTRTNDAGEREDQTHLGAVVIGDQALMRIVLAEVKSEQRLTQALERDVCLKYSSSTRGEKCTWCWSFTMSALAKLAKDKRIKKYLGASQLDRGRIQQCVLDRTEEKYGTEQNPLKPDVTKLEMGPIQPTPTFDLVEGKWIL